MSTPSADRPLVTDRPYGFRAIVTLAPRRFLDFRHFGLMDRDGEFVLGGFQDGGRLPFQLGDHPGGDREREQVGGDLADLPLAEARPGVIRAH
jgi:hypothetical protein